MTRSVPPLHPSQSMVQSQALGKKKRSWPLAGPPLLFMTQLRAAAAPAASCVIFVIIFSFCVQMSKWCSASILGKLGIKLFPLFFLFPLPSLLICLSHAAATWLETSLLGKIALVKGWMSSWLLGEKGRTLQIVSQAFVSHLPFQYTEVSKKSNF